MAQYSRAESDTFSDGSRIVDFGVSVHVFSMFLLLSIESNVCLI